MLLRPALRARMSQALRRGGGLVAASARPSARLASRRTRTTVSAEAARAQSGRTWRGKLAVAAGARQVGPGGGAGAAPPWQTPGGALFVFSPHLGLPMRCRGQFLGPVCWTWAGSRGAPLLRTQVQAAAPARPVVARERRLAPAGAPAALGRPRSPGPWRSRSRLAEASAPSWWGAEVAPLPARSRARGLAVAPGPRARAACGDAGLRSLCKRSRTTTRAACADCAAARIALAVPHALRCAMTCHCCGAAPGYPLPGMRRTTATCVCDMRGRVAPGHVSEQAARVPAEPHGAARRPNPRRVHPEPRHVPSTTVVHGRGQRQVKYTDLLLPLLRRAGAPGAGPVLWGLPRATHGAVEPSWAAGSGRSADRSPPASGCRQPARVVTHGCVHETLTLTRSDASDHGGRVPAAADHRACWPAKSPSATALTSSHLQ